MVYGEHSLTGQKISNGVLFELAHLLSRFYAFYGSLQQRGISQLQYDIATNLTFNPIHISYMIIHDAQFADDRVLFLYQIWLRYDTQ